MKGMLIITYLLPIMPVWHIGQHFCAVSVTRGFYGMRLLTSSPTPHPPGVGLTLVWILLLDLSGLGGPTRGVNTPAGIALGVIGTHKPLGHVKATVPVSGMLIMDYRNCWRMPYSYMFVSFLDHVHI